MKKHDLEKSFTHTRPEPTTNPPTRRPKLDKMVATEQEVKTDFAKLVKLIELIRQIDKIIPGLNS